jgi:NAD+ synthase (glutamine-hydrolysing)
MLVALGQINPTVGDLEGNLRLVLRTLREGAEAGASLVVLPELALTGYPPEDLLQKPAFLRDTQEALGRILESAPPVLGCLGYPRADSGHIRNSAVIFNGPDVVDIYDKGTLPNYGVFDEKRYFSSSVRCPVYRWGPWRVAVNICEDLWTPAGIPKIQAYEGGAQLFINLSASPFHSGKGELRESLVRRRALQYGAHVLYVNQVGGQDELVYDGRSLAASPSGEIIARAKAFDEDLLLVHLPDRPPPAAPDPDVEGEEPLSEGLDFIEEHLYLDRSSWPGAPGPCPSPGSRVEPVIAGEKEDYRALTLGVRDYVRKNGFQEVVIGLSGGIDSALTAAVAVDALGPEAVTGLAMPSEYSSPESLRDAKELAQRLGHRFLIQPIGEIYQTYLRLLQEPFAGQEPDVTEENLQARIRGNLLMAHSNKFGSLVLTTGNKSELAVGYCTLYGDMAGGYAVLKDVFKTHVYRLAHWRNAQGPGEGPIPRNTLERPPSAELRPDQLDQDTLPEYEVLDPILERLVEKEEAPEDLVDAGFDAEMVCRVSRWVDANEYKRRQSPPGVRLTPRAFGKDRRYPITNRYRCHLD